MSQDAKLQAIKLAMEQIEKQYGKGAVMRLGDEAEHNVEAISTGSLSLDIALGIGGYPKGRIIEIYGPESSGKTTLALHTISEVQKLGGIAAFVDAEHAFDPDYARKIGLKVEELLMSKIFSVLEAVMLKTSTAVEVEILNGSSKVSSGVFVAEVKSKVKLPLLSTEDCH